MNYNLNTERLFKSTRHYDLQKGLPILSDKLNISLNQNCSKANYTYSLKIRDNNKWSKQITGLFPTYDANIFFGDTEGKKNLIIFRFLENGYKLKVYFFREFYTRKLVAFLRAFKAYY
ncbi:hypothetical protein BUL40_00290 [Croceivirga radicis]|uniref:Uncharacterized protein n=2 Tax=Croceivirga radicis TaxID=1929488 RepID=A0A1V6LV37_9FLAO|nr:hypothetical protein BUL40_00290 [Croceivirga radicis]